MTNDNEAYEKTDKARESAWENVVQAEVARQKAWAAYEAGLWKAFEAANAALEASEVKQAFEAAKEAYEASEVKQAFEAAWKAYWKAHQAAQEATSSSTNQEEPTP